jgi:polysaccharide biosynthesis transport protein
LRVRYRDDHPDLVQLRAVLESVKREEERVAAKSAAPGQTATKGTPPPARPVTVASTNDAKELIRAREQVSSLRAQVKAAEKDLADRLAGQERILRDIRAAQSRMERLPVREQEMAGITRDYEMSKINYKTLLDKKLAAEMALDMERRQKSERFTVIDSAKVPEIPIKPKRPLLYAIGSVASLVLGLLVGFAREAKQNVILGEWELPDDCAVLARLPFIAIPPHGAVPEAAPPAGKPRGRKRLLAAFSAALLSVVGLVAAGLYFFHWF